MLARLQLLTAPTLVTLAIVAAMLDGASIRYAHAMIPYYILATLEICGMLAMCIIFCKANSSEDRRISSGICAVLAVIVTLSLIAEVAPAVAQDSGSGSISAGPIVIPVAIGAGLLALAWCAISALLWYRSRSEQFTDLYDFEWARAGARAPAMPAGAALRGGD